MNIQIFGSSKSFDTKKAERWFKERRIKYQYIDVLSKGLSPREYQSVKQKVGFDALVNTKCRAYEELYMAYITPDAREEKLLDVPGAVQHPHRPQRQRGHRWLLPGRSGASGSKIFSEGDTAMWGNTLPKNPVSALLRADGRTVTTSTTWPSRARLWPFTCCSRSSRSSFSSAPCWAC